MRAIVALAMSTGIPVREWLDGDERVLDTALDLLTSDSPPRRAPGGVQMSG